MVYQAQRRLRPPRELAALRDELLDMQRTASRAVYVHEGSCRDRGAEQFSGMLAQRVGGAAPPSSLRGSSLKRTGCHGLCSAGQTVTICPPGVFYVDVSVEDVNEIACRTVGEGEIITDLTFLDAVSGCHIPLKHDIPFFRNQTRRIARHCGEIDPERIEDSLKSGGYAALARALEEMTPSDVVELVAASGLRGRGHEGRPCAEKWATFAKSASPSRCLTVYMKDWPSAAASDRLLLEGDPHLVLEGMALAALATGCETGRLLIAPGEMGALRTVQAAVEQAGAYGLLGEGILGTTFDFPLEVVALAEADAAGHGRRDGHPQGASRELWHNVETVANLPQIVLRGADAFRGVGTEAWPGTTLVVLSGDLRYRGVAEVPCGTPVREIIERIGGGGAEQEGLCGVHIGGPAGRMVSLEPGRGSVDDEAAPVAMGSGAGDIAAFGDPAIAVTRALEAAEFIAGGCCGKCAPCRIGTKRIEEILQQFSRRRGSPSGMDDMREIGELLRSFAGCDWGEHGADCVLSALEHFETTFVGHISVGCRTAELCHSGGTVAEVGR